MKNVLYIPRMANNDLNSSVANYWHSYDTEAEGSPFERQVPNQKFLFERELYEQLYPGAKGLLYLSNGKGGGRICYLDQTIFIREKPGVMLSVELPCKTATADRAVEYIGCGMPDFLSNIKTADDVKTALSDPDPDTWFKAGGIFASEHCALQGNIKVLALCVLDALIVRKLGNGKPVLLIAQRLEQALMVLKIALRFLPALLRTHVSFFTNATKAGDLRDFDIACASTDSMQEDLRGEDVAQKISLAALSTAKNTEYWSAYCRTLSTGKLDAKDIDREFGNMPSFQQLETTAIRLFSSTGSREEEPFPEPSHRMQSMQGGNGETAERQKFSKNELENGRKAHLDRLARYVGRKKSTDGVENIYYRKTARKAAVRRKWKFRLKHYLLDIFMFIAALVILLMFRPIVQSIKVGGKDPIGSWDALMQTFGLMGRGWECLLLSLDLPIGSIPILPLGIILLSSIFVAGGYGLHCGETTGFVLRRIFALAFMIALFWALLLIFLMYVYVW